MTCLVNGATEEDAVTAAKVEGMGSVSDTYLIKPADIERWESLVPIVRKQRSVE